MAILILGIFIALFAVAWFVGSFISFGERGRK